MQKVIDRELTHVTSSVIELAAVSAKPSLTVNEAAAVLDGVTQRLTSLKRKVKA